MWTDWIAPRVACPACLARLSWEIVLLRCHSCEPRNRGLPCRWVLTIDAASRFSNAYPPVLCVFL